MDRDSLAERVAEAAERVLARQPSVSALDLLMAMRWLERVHVEMWQKGHDTFPFLEPRMQSRREKRVRVIQEFQHWAADRGLTGFRSRYLPRSRGAETELPITADADTALEDLYRVSFLRPGLSPKRQEATVEKAQKAPELAVFEAFHDQACSECNATVEAGGLVFMEKGKPVCLTCADLDHLTLLPSGDPALTRRARKHSQLWAAVLTFNRRLRRQVRIGLLVTAEALAKAEDECAADDEERAERRRRAEVDRTAADQDFIREVTAAILTLYPACTPDTAAAIAGHACQRGSGRVGRTAAAKALSPEALTLAVAAHVRHVHTNYDTLLLTGNSRERARDIVRPRVAAILTKWQRHSG
ncbi:MAG: hypothetical protein A3K19_27400 [Lentisphaerae bacterium RIFOXYB12_FULL_65_16]|nr:MAG: hypothetical protein A3K18_24025 [Lentisphaerae bacterium RIFOXYA12_64_32]OGV86439.1 MAG: hypothetical protein A3K19_27400 [Lentisphaerae bacterium RIFOXYB12_FULL_65_16]